MNQYIHIVFLFLKMMINHDLLQNNTNLLFTQKYGE